jgi:hypothetical protein
MNGDTIMLFTEAEGEVIKTHWVTEEGYERIKEAGKYIYNDGRDKNDVVLYPAFIALARIEDNFDFILGRTRERAAA